MKDLPKWQLRFLNYQSALTHLKEATDIGIDNLSELERDGLIQRFEFTLELAWKVMKDFILYQGATIDILGSRDATREAFKIGLLKEGDIWMSMITDRNLTSHIYEEDTAVIIADKIINQYLHAFIELESSLTTKIDSEEE